MKQSFLDSLVGMSARDAKSKILAEGYDEREIPAGSVVASGAYQNLVVIETEDDIVVYAYASDATQVEKDG